MKHTKQLFGLLLLGLFLFTIPSTTLASFISSYPEPTILVKKGSTGTNVKWIQDMLNHVRISS